MRLCARERAAEGRRRHGQGFMNLTGALGQIAAADGSRLHEPVRGDGSDDTIAHSASFSLVLVSLADKIDPLRPVCRAAQLHVAVGADAGKARRTQPRGQLLGGVAALAVILEPALPRAVRPQVKEVDIVAAYPAAELRAPDTVGVLRLVEVDLPGRDGGTSLACSRRK